MCHLFSAVSPYALPLLRRPVPRGWGDQRETGDPSATWWRASHQQIISAEGESHGLGASVPGTAAVPQPWQGPADVGSSTRAEKEGWDGWVIHSVLGVGIKPVGSAWPCGFLSFWAGICKAGGAAGWTVFATALFSLG